MKSPRRSAGGTGDGPAAGNDYTIDVLTRTVQVLRALSGATRPLQLTEIAAAAQTTSSTAFRILWNLERAGLADRSSGEGYALGPLALVLGASYGAQNVLVNRGRPLVDHLRDETGETSALVIRDGALRFCLYHAESRQAVRRSLTLGPLGELWRGAAGRLLFANLPPAERAAVLSLYPQAGQDDANLVATHENGVVSAMRDTSADIWSVAAPVRLPDGQVIAAVACTGPIQRCDQRHLQHCQVLTAAAAQTLSAAIVGTPR
ncbi:helix-turn-helix domain-containing protein [Roseomonas terrae]|uniref:Helix-turn-helix domain-containing protein n=1 Tax=Neoroseomonas terrae TaxID=424799 RepID=A0ABS5EIJ9_9PROT|nr:helix-turn-helix domain-containing protein [Neoroseomonas terrae]MBR0650853.1 helix-turn-helix domain-containing protein [Neoroseomonas terrae]